jgi:DNA-binding MarR family transcriptional regulator
MMNAVVREALDIDDPVLVSRMLAKLDQDGLIKRTVQGKRCYRIQLTKAGEKQASELPALKTKPKTSAKAPAKAKVAAAGKSAPTKKAPVNKTPVKKAPVKKAPVNKTSVKKATPSAKTAVATSATTTRKQRGTLGEVDQRIIALLNEAPSHRITDVDGRMNSILRSRLGVDDSFVISRSLAALDKAGLINRVLHGKRCPLLELTKTGIAFANGSDVTPSVSTEITPARAPEGAPVLSAATKSVTAATPAKRAIAAEPVASDGKLAAAVANELLEQLIERVSAVDLQPKEVAELRTELAKVTSACEEAEHRTVLAEQTLTAVRAEAKVWEERCAQLEKNLDAAMRGPDRTREVYERTRELSAMISSRPNS